MTQALKLLNIKNSKRLELSIVFVNDKKMQALNKLHRGIDKTTDVLSFPLYNPLNSTDFLPDFSPDMTMRQDVIPLLIGDIVISTDQALQQSVENNFSIYEELTRLLIHGLVHLIGYDHEINQFQAKKMIKKEEEIINAFKKMD